MLDKLKLILVAAAGVLLIAVGVVVVVRRQPLLPIGPLGQRPPANTTQPPTAPPPGQGAGVRLARFTSEAEVREYLSRASTVSGFGLNATGSFRALEAAPSPALGLDSAGSAPQAQGSVPDRVSGTNVQVQGIDEPDILKTDGKMIYLSSPSYYAWRGGAMPMIEPGFDVRLAPGIVPPQPREGIRNLNAFPPADLKVVGAIAASGDLLLSSSTLVVFQYNKIVGYNVADPAKPEQAWSVDFKDSTQFVAARLREGQLYLVTRQGVNLGRPCPLVPFEVGGRAVTIPCTDIYHPAVAIPADVTYTVAAIDPANGQVSRAITFVGLSQEAPVYMSEAALYVTYAYPGDQVAYLYGFLQQNSDLVPSWLLERLSKLRGYELTDEAKVTELMRLMERWLGGLSGDDRLKLENELQNRLRTYAEAHQRELQYTGIAKVAVPELAVAATGSVPGRLLNQFSLDEHQGNLRVATTVGQNWLWGWGAGAESVSDVYVLGPNLDTLGSVQDLGRGERIYSVRFLGDEGYVVTFRQIDPFYVVNLANPRAPRLAGELKIPGFSSYLHPLALDRVLGVGQDQGKVKLSLFDVSDPANPREAATYLLDDYWSEVSSTHHAFLQDAKHAVFYLPGGKGGYVFSYQGDQLQLTKAVSNIQARRALYLNDYLYVVGDDRIVVLSETDWERVKELEL